MTEATNLGRITESRTDSAWGIPAAPVKNLGWFNGRAYTPAQLSLDRRQNENGTRTTLRH